MKYFILYSVPGHGHGHTDTDTHTHTHTHRPVRNHCRLTNYELLR